MAEPRMADFLQGRTRSYAPSEFTTADEMRQERISQALGWDTTQPSARFRETLVRHLPAMLGFIGPRAFVPSIPRAVPQSPPSQLSQGQRDLYALDPRGGPAVGEGLEYWRAQGAATGLNPRLPPVTPRDPYSAHQYFRAFGELENLSRPPNNRLNSLLPLGAAGAGLTQPPDGY